MVIMRQLFKDMSNWVITGIMQNGTAFITLWIKLQEGTAGLLGSNMIPLLWIYGMIHLNSKTLWLCAVLSGYY